MTSTTEVAEITEDDLQGFESLAPAERAERILALSARVAQGASDSDVLPAILRLVENEVDTAAREAWISYFGSSRSDVFFAFLESWLEDSDEDRRMAVISALAWNQSARTNDVLLQTLTRDPSVRVRRLALKYLVRRGSLGHWEPVDLLAIVPESDWRPVTKREYLRLIGVAAKE